MQCIDNQPPTLVSQLPLITSTNVTYNITLLVLVFSEAVTLGVDGWIAIDQLTSTGVVVNLLYTLAMNMSMVRSNYNRTLTVTLPVGLFKLETRYGTGGTV